MRKTGEQQSNYIIRIYIYICASDLSITESDNKLVKRRKS